MAQTGEPGVLHACGVRSKNNEQNEQIEIEQFERFQCRVCIMQQGTFIMILVLPTP